MLTCSNDLACFPRALKDGHWPFSSGNRGSLSFSFLIFILIISENYIKFFPNFPICFSWGNDVFIMFLLMRENAKKAIIDGDVLLFFHWRVGGHVWSFECDDTVVWPLPVVDGKAYLLPLLLSVNYNLSPPGNLSPRSKDKNSFP